MGNQEKKDTQLEQARQKAEEVRKSLAAMQGALANLDRELEASKKKTEEIEKERNLQRKKVHKAEEACEKADTAVKRLEPMTSEQIACCVAGSIVGLGALAGGLAAFVLCVPYGGPILIAFSLVAALMGSIVAVECCSGSSSTASCAG